MPANRQIRKQTLLADLYRPEFSLHMEAGPDGTILHLAGELDAVAAARFAACVDEIVRNRPGEVVVNARELEFIDSSGLHVLLNAQRRLTRQSRRLRLICPPGAVRRAIELSRLSETFGLTPDPH